MRELFTQMESGTHGNPLFGFAIFPRPGEVFAPYLAVWDPTSPDICLENSLIAGREGSLFNLFPERQIHKLQFYVDKSHNCIIMIIERVLSA